MRPVERDGQLDAVGRETIKAYSLNRVELVAKRRVQLKLMTYRRDVVLSKLKKTGVHDLGWRKDLDTALEEARILKQHCKNDQEFTAMKRTMVKDSTDYVHSLLNKKTKIGKE